MAFAPPRPAPLHPPPRSAIYGAHLLAQGVLAYLVKQKQITPERAAQLNVTAVIWGVGCLGFLWQLSTGPPPPVLVFTSTAGLGMGNGTGIPFQVGVGS